MNALTRRNRAGLNLTAVATVTAVLVVSALLGQHASPFWLALLVAGVGVVALLQRPILGLLVLIALALILPVEITTGTEVLLNPVALLIPVLLLLWLLDGLRRRDVRLVPSATTRPLALFLLAGLLSLLIGRVTWDPLVPFKSNFILVQLAQWAIFAFSGIAFWLTANLVRAERQLWRLTACFLLLAGSVAILRSVPGIASWINRFTTVALIRAPFWVLLAALAGGQLVFNQRLSLVWRMFLLVVLGATLYYAFVAQQEATSNWVGLVTVVGTLAWLRFPRLRLPAVALILVMAAIGILLPAVYEFAGGEAEWQLSGGSRLVLIQRVVEESMRNPITGLGPAAYRPYANVRPLVYEHVFWANPAINSHNNYVDLFAHVGLVGLALFGWFAVEVARLGYRLHNQYSFGFKAAYVNGMMAAGAAALVLMLFADWILPFVYNIGFPGFQASVLVWIFLGGLVALENMPEASEHAAPMQSEVEQTVSSKQSESITDP